MLTHTDPQTNALFEILQKQRDDAMLRAVDAEVREGVLKASNAALTEQVAGLNESLMAALKAQEARLALVPQPESASQESAA